MRGEKIEVNIPKGRYVVTLLIFSGLIITFALLGGSALAKHSS